MSTVTKLVKGEVQSGTQTVERHEDMENGSGVGGIVNWSEEK